MRSCFQLFLLAYCATSRCIRGQELRSWVTVEYDYQVEVFQLSNNSSSPFRSSTQDVLTDIDAKLVQRLQKLLPNNGVTDNAQLPNVQFLNVSSNVYSACFTSSDECSLVRSNLVVEYEGQKPDHSVESVAVRLVREYLEKYSVKNPHAIITFQYPFLVDSLTAFHLKTIDSVMGDVEIELMEDTFVEVFGAVVSAMEGDTAILGSKFIYQGLLQHPQNNTFLRSSSVEQDPPTTTLTADFYTYGSCRECSDVEFGGVVYKVIVANLGAFRSRLQANGKTANTTYFDNVEEISFAVPTLPDPLPPTDQADVYDSQPPQPNPGYPWYFYMAFFMSMFIILGGLYIIYKDKSDLHGEKDEDQFSTESESVDGSKIEEYVVADDDGGDEYEDVNGTTLDEYQVEAVLSSSEDTEGAHVQ